MPNCTRITEKLAKRLKNVKIILTSDATFLVNKMQRRKTNTRRVAELLEAIGFLPELIVTRVGSDGRFYDVKGWVRSI